MAGSGYFEIKYTGPWKGLDVMQPEFLIDPASTPFSNNMLLRNSELRSRFRQNPGLPALAGNVPINLIDTFLDANGVVHTVAVSRAGLFQLNRTWKKNPNTAWNMLAPFPVGAAGQVVSSQVYLNKIFFTAGSNHLWYWDGITSASVANPTGFLDAAITTTTTPVGTTYGGLYLGELNFQLLLLNTFEGKGDAVSNFSQRIRWCPSGDPFIWDPAANIGAGFNDMLDVPDDITGFLAIGRSGFVFRRNGITELTSISQGALPFDFNHLWASERGIGSVFPSTIAGFGPIGIFISADDVYELTLSGFNKIGGGAVDALYNDLTNATATPLASIVPTVQGNYIYLMYMLSIPLNEDSAMWIYDINGKSWQRWFKPQGVYGGPTKFVAVA